MAHNKRHSMPSNWPLARKGNVYFVNSNHSQYSAIPLLVALRDVLQIAKTAKEVRLMQLANEVLVNDKVRKEPQFPVQVFDVLNLPKLGKNYRLEVAGKKLKFNEVSGKEASKKIVKSIGKVQISKNIVQINLEDGSNFLIKENFAVGDSAVLNLKERKIEKILPMKEGSKVLVVAGKHSGKNGKIKEVLTVNNKKQYLIKFEDSEVVLPMKTILAVE